MPERTPHNGHEFTGPAEPLAAHSPVLKTNDTLNELCSIIQEATPDWTYLIDMLGNKRTHNSVEGYFAEMHVADVLEEEAENSFRDRLITTPIEDNVLTRTFRFSINDRQNNNFVVAHRKTNIEFTEYDALTEVDGLPVVWEVKTGTSKKSGLESALSPAEIDRKFKPLMEYYRTNTFGYVVATVRERLDPESPVQQRFQERGGLLIAMTPSMEEIRERIITDSPTQQTIYSSNSSDWDKR